MGIERFHVHRPIPSRAHDLREPLGIVPVGLVHLHLECGTGMSRIEANNVKPSLAQFMHKPRRHRAGFDPNAGIVSRMPSHRPLNLLRICMTLASPESATRIVNHADRSQLLRNVQTNKSGHRAVSHVRTAGQQRPDHGTMERSGPQPRLPDVHIWSAQARGRDYPMSTYGALRPAAAIPRRPHMERSGPQPRLPDVHIWSAQARSRDYPMSTYGALRPAAAITRCPHMERSGPQPRLPDVHIWSAQARSRDYPMSTYGALRPAAAITRCPHMERSGPQPRLPDVHIWSAQARSRDYPMSTY